MAAVGYTGKIFRPVPINCQFSQCAKSLRLSSFRNVLCRTQSSVRMLTEGLPIFQRKTKMLSRQNRERKTNIPGFSVPIYGSMPVIGVCPTWPLCLKRVVSSRKQLTATGRIGYKRSVQNCTCLFRCTPPYGKTNNSERQKAVKSG